MPLRYVDPHKKRGLGYWAAGSFGRSPAGQWFTRQVSVRLDPWALTTMPREVVRRPLVAR
jgi:hypothetical protein